MSAATRSVSDLHKPVRDRSVVRAALARIRAAGFMAEIIAGEQYRVGPFEFWPATGFWRDQAGEPRGYTVAGLIQALRAKQVEAA